MAVGGGGDVAYAGCVSGDMAVGVAVGSERRGGGDSGGDVACCLPTSLDEGRGTRRYWQ